jgi:hypothetical protein
MYEKVGVKCVAYRKIVEIVKPTYKRLYCIDVPIKAVIASVKFRN